MSFATSSDALQKIDGPVDQESEGGTLKVMELFCPILDVTTRDHGGVKLWRACRH
jgi:hypothetical protein